MKRFLAMMLLPLSIVPIALAVPYVADQHASFRARYVDRDALAAPAVRRMAYAPVPVYRDRIPVLVYHGLNDGGARYSMSRQAFAAQMAALKSEGFHTVSASRFAAFARGADVPLPSRPILITFDDGRVDSFRGADAVLQENGYRATMFAIAGRTVEGSPTYLSPDELSSLERSGRWDIQFHAGDGHTQVPAAGGGRKPFYATREPGESLAAFRTRVSDDLDDGMARLKRDVPGVDLGDLFAVPYSDYGQDGDDAVSMTSMIAMTSRFTGVFLQDATVRPTRRGEHGLLSRYEPPVHSTPTDLLRKLRAGIKEN